MTTAPKKQPIPFGKYLLLDRINIGGMAEVWRGKMFGAGGFERLVAIKRILPSIAEDEEFITMFIDEAKISVQLTHANIAQIYELGNLQSSYFIAMEYIPGKDLRAIFERCRKKGEPAPIPLSCYVISKLCEGLDYAHRKKDGMGRDMNIVHRDVSPQNVLVSFEGEVKVIDFGIAKAANKATKTQAGILKGKFGYMSPEQIRGLPLDRRSDVFAIGVCLYEMLTGERLFVGDSDFAVLEKVRKAEIIPPSTYNRRIPETLEKIVLKALARETSERYQYANELADDLQRFLITSDSIFSRKDLNAYMKATFAEEVEREKIRLQEYAEVRAPEGMAAAAEAGLGGFGTSPSVPTRPAPSGVLPTATGSHRPPSLSAVPPSASGPKVSPVASLGGNVDPASLPSGPTVPALKRTPSLTSLPKLTAAAPLSAQQLDDGGGATQIADDVNSGESGPGELPPEPNTDASQQAAQALEDEDRTSHERPGVRGVIPARATGTSLPAVNRPRASGSQEPVRRPSLSDIPQLSPAGDARPKTRQERASGERAPSIGAAPTDTRPASRDDAPLAANSHKVKLLAAVASVVAVAAAILIFVFLRPAPEGFVVVDVLDPAARAKARVNINGEELGVPRGWPLLQKTQAGNAVVMVVADGYRPFVSTVEVKEGAHPTTVNAELKPMVEQVDLIVLAEPETAEIAIDGKVVKAAGERELYAGKLNAGAHEVTVRLDGYRTATEKLDLSGGETRKLQIRLQPDMFELSLVTQPAGATVMLGGKSLGVTPASLKIPAGSTSVTLVKRCFDPEEIPLQPPQDPSASVSLSRTLKKQPNCR